MSCCKDCVKERITIVRGVVDVRTMLEQERRIDMTLIACDRQRRSAMSSDKAKDRR